MQKITEFKCPICNSFLISAPGSRTQKEGITLYCDNKSCPCQEIMGFGKNAQAAYSIILDKYKI